MTEPTPGIDFPFTAWDIANMERTISDGIVYTVHYTVNHFEGGEQVSAYGSIGLEAPEAGTAIPYANLTKETVIQWVKDKFGPEKVAEIEQALSDQTREKLNPTKSSGTPWTE
jgi:macrodomain Ter protein organizer (MatP/YcbG family)